MWTGNNKIYSVTRKSLELVYNLLILFAMKLYLKYLCIITLLLNLTDFVRAERIKVTDQVYFDLSKNGGPIGRIVIGLFGELAPKTVENFKQIVAFGIDGKTYCGTRFHRVIKRFMIQGGDIIYNNGMGSISIFGTEFEDENLDMEFKISGLIAMANRGKDTNGCQFFITTIPTPWLNGLHTIFGKVTEGQKIVHVIEHESTDVNDHPLHDITISDCGIIKTTEPFYVSDEQYDIWAWLYASAAPLSMSFAILITFQYFIKKLDKYIN